MNINDSDYKVQIDGLRSPQWNEALQCMDDAVFYQTWSYGAIRWGEENLSHVLLWRGGVLVGAAQARIVKLFSLPAGIAYITWGPLWKPKGRKARLEDLRKLLRVLYQEYVRKRGLFLRILPQDWEGDLQSVSDIYESEGFAPSETLKPYRTWMVNSSLSEEERRKSLRKNWRHSLKKALENQKLTVICGKDEFIFDKLRKLYWEMRARKQFVEFIDMEEFDQIQKDLPHGLKMTIAIAEYEGRPVSAAAWSCIGRRAVGLFLATGNEGMKLCSSNLLIWNQYRDLMDKRCLWSDEGGYDPDNFPSVSHFKDGVAGKDVQHLFPYEACTNTLSNFCVSAGDGLRRIWRGFRLELNEIRKEFLTFKIFPEEPKESE